MLGASRSGRVGGKMARGRLNGAPPVGGRLEGLEPSNRPGVVVPLRVAVRGGLSGERERDDSSPTSLEGLKRTVFVERFRECPGLYLMGFLLGDMLGPE